MTDNQWERLEPLLPPQKPQRGRPNADHRRIINAILWIDRTASPWRDLPEKYGPWRTVASRFYRWQKAEVWDQVLKALQSHKDAEGELDWEVHYLDSTIVRAHQLASGAKGGDQKEQALGYSQGGFSTKVHIRSERRGKPMVFYLSEGQRNEMVGFWALMESGEVKRVGRGGRPRLRPRRISAPTRATPRGVLRRYLRRLGIRMTIPRRTNEHRGGPFDREIYRTRNLIERLINRLKLDSTASPCLEFCAYLSRLG